MSRRSIDPIDSRQIGFEFEFTPEAPLGAFGGFDQIPKATITIPAPKVLADDPLPAPAKVKSVFDLFFEAQAQREALRLTKPSVKRKLIPDDYPDIGRSNFDWTEQEMIRLHALLLDTQVEVFAGNRTSRESKIEAIDWIFGTPDISSERFTKEVDVQASTNGFDHNIPFTFACACHLTGHDPEEMQTLIKQYLRETGQSHLLA